MPKYGESHPEFANFQKRMAELKEQSEQASSPENVLALVKKSFGPRESFTATGLILKLGWQDNLKELKELTAGHLETLALSGILQKKDGKTTTFYYYQ